MSSHREAPEISKDPVADSTDVYAFVSPDRPNTVTLVANYIPLQGPAGGPNFYQFGDHVRYAIHIDTHGHSEANITYEFDFATKFLNVHSIAIQVPISRVTAAARPTIGVWTSASRQRARLHSADGGPDVLADPFHQVSRLGNPLVNEVLIPIGKKDFWNTQHPVHDKQFAHFVAHPELGGLLPVLYPGVFPNLAALDKAKKARADLEAILLTGIPKGIVPGFTNFTGPVPADMLRLNTSIPPASKPNILGLLGGDAAGFPNGRRVFDDVVSVELRAIAGVTFALVDPSYKVDAAAGQLTDGLTPADLGTPYLQHFPYLGVPYDGYDQ